MNELDIEDIEKYIEIPKDEKLGDYSLPCFFLAKQMKKSPIEIAKEIAEKLRKNQPEEIEKIEIQNAYVNFFMNKNIFAGKILKEILKRKEKYGYSKEGKGKTIVFDMSSPNIAKPFGIGHLRSTIIGNSLSEIYKKLGYKTIKINYLGDWGTQFGKLIVGYKHFVNDEQLAKNPIQHMLELYVKANAEEYEQEARDWFKKLENNDKEALGLWKKFKALSLKEFDKIYELFGIKFDVISGESFYNNLMDNTIKELKKKNLLEESEKAMVVNLEKYNLGVCLMQKSDKASLYATRDITAAIDRHKKYKFTKMIYEVGAEQKLHFQQIFKVLNMMGYKWAENCIHVYHGLYLDKDGKKFATRKGKTIFMEDILDETITKAIEIIKDKNPELKNKEEAARKIAIAAIFYGDLKNDRIKDIIFDIEKFLDFEGNTGPYLLYSYARASSILRKAKSKKAKKDKNKELEEKEFLLVKKLAEFPEIIKHAEEQLSPNIIANYAYELCQIFNEFYHACPVINSEKENFRIELVKAFRIVIKQALFLLGIEVLEEM